MVVAEESSGYPEVMEELKKIGDTGFPIAAMSLVGYLKNMVLVVCMGRLGSLELAGGALAIGFTNITGYSVLSGLAMGMEPLCSQAFGSRNQSIASLTLQRTILMLLVASIPITLLWANLEPLMLCLHQEPEIARVASLYCQFSVPDLIANSILHPLRVYLRSKGTTWPLMWCTLASIVLHLPITIFLTFTLSLGVPGIAISTFVANFNTLLFLICYMFFTHVPDQPTLLISSPHDKTSNVQVLLPLESGLKATANSYRAPLLSKSTVTATLGEEWRTLLGLAVPSCLAVCLEWWWYELMTILAGYLPKPRVALATSAIMIQTTSLLYTFPSALSGSVSARVGNELGAGRPNRARSATIAAIGLSLTISLLGLFLTTLGREPWAGIFTEDTEILDLTMKVLPIIGMCELANCPQTTSCGILRGSARPGVGAKINFCSFYVVGAPVAVFLSFYMELGFVGLCYGLLAAQIACVVSILTVVYRTDWEAESLKAKDLVGF